MHIFLLETSRLILRPFTRRDLPDFIAYRNQPKVSRYQSWHTFSAKEAEEFYSQQQSISFNQDESWFQVALEHQDSKRLIGDFAIHFFDDGRQVELGFTLHPQYQHQGYAAEAAQALLRLLFTNLKKHRATAITDAENTAAHRFLQRLGFRQEAHFIKNVMFKGLWADEYAFALLKDEYEKQG